MFFKPSKIEGFQHFVPADLCGRTDIIILKDTALSSAVYATYFRKLSTYSKFFELLAEEINKLRYACARRLHVSCQERVHPINHKGKQTKSRRTKCSAIEEGFQTLWDFGILDFGFPGLSIQGSSLLSLVRDDTL